MRASIRGVDLYFDVNGMGLAPDGDRMVERPVLFLLHGGPGGDHASFKSRVANLVLSVTAPSFRFMDEARRLLAAVRGFLTGDPFGDLPASVTRTGD